MITMTTRHTRRSVRPAAAPAPVQPAAPQCLHPSCHAHNSHQTAQHVGQVPAMPATAPAAPRVPWYRKITKNVVIGFLIVIIIGLAGSLNDDDHKIADLQQQVRHAKVTQGSRAADLDYAIKLCGKIAAKGDEAECITTTLARR